MSNLNRIFKEMKALAQGRNWGLTRAQLKRRALETLRDYPDFHRY